MTSETSSVQPELPFKMDSDRGSLERAIAGALASTIDAHGPITLKNRSSAAKRIIGAIKMWDKRRNDI